MRQRAPAKSSLAICGYRDLELVTPRLAVWRCVCRLRNQVGFSRDAAVGYAFPQVLECSGCHALYRGRTIVAPVVIAEVSEAT